MAAQNNPARPAANQAPSIPWVAWTAGALLVLALAIAAVLIWSPNSNAGFRDAAAVLGIITATAVGIERIIESFWTLVELAGKGPWWPLSPIARDISTVVANLSATLQPFYAKAESAMNDLAKANQWTDAQIAAAKAEIDALQKQVDDLKTLAPKNQNAQIIAVTASQGIGFLEQKYPGLKEAADVATSLIGDVSNLVASFQDNPGRRLISIFVGMLFGLAVAGVLGLNLVLATIGVNPKAAGALLLQRGGIVLTGLVMGLGSNPTHEIIRLLQEFKKSQKAQNDAVAGSGT